MKKPDAIIAAQLRKLLFKIVRNIDSDLRTIYHHDQILTFMKTEDTCEQKRKRETERGKRERELILLDIGFLASYIKSTHKIEVMSINPRRRNMLTKVCITYTCSSTKTLDRLIFFSRKMIAERNSKDLEPKSMYHSCFLKKKNALSKSKKQVCINFV